MPVKKNNDYLVPLEELLEAGCHFGHQSRRWHPKMGQFIWGERAGVHIFDLTLTQKYLQEACRYASQLSSEGKIIVFIGTKRQASPIIKEEAERVGVPYIANRWLGGTITNWEQISKSVKRLRELKSKKAAGDLDHYTKKERVLFDREISRLTRIIGGIEKLDEVPSALFVVDIKREAAAVFEARQAKIPVIAIVDTNCNPDLIDKIIPANDDAVKSIRLLVNKLAEAVLAGKSGQGGNKESKKSEETKGGKGSEESKGDKRNKEDRRDKENQKSKRAKRRKKVRSKK